MKVLALYLKQSRPMVALVAIIFMVLGGGKHGETQFLSLKFLAAALAILSSYALAASLNDILDKEIDEINLAKEPSRPLVVGDGTKNDLYAVALLAGVVCILLGFLVGWLAGVAMLAILAIDSAYSLKPFVLSRRTHVAPLVLPLVYAVFPFAIGVVASGQYPGVSDVSFMAGFYLLFLSRIILKDFRDRAGDRKFGKLTFLLRYGKKAVLAVSVTALGLGGSLVVASLHASYFVSSLLISYLAVAVWALYRIGLARDIINEMVGIGLFAKAGNAFLLSILAYMILRSSGATQSGQVGALALLALLMMANLVMFIRFPKFARLSAPKPQKLLN
jgi:4-hydroxybenzoate polyprenyltransferase